MLRHMYSIRLSAIRRTIVNLVTAFFCQKSRSVPLTYAVTVFSDFSHNNKSFCCQRGTGTLRHLRRCTAKGNIVPMCGHGLEQIDFPWCLLELRVELQMPGISLNPHCYDQCQIDGP